MIRRICRNCGSEMVKELTSEGPKFFCETCSDYSPYDAFDMDPFCPECDEMLQFCGKCSSGFFCNRCGCILSRKHIVWKNR
ncbi:MAG: hypothetical protein PWP34_2305 [Desulfuromonadales bacterium]|nr:hypothetical protein [Desulfuromonadales bacterium]